MLPYAYGFFVTICIFYDSSEYSDRYLLNKGVKKEDNGPLDIDRTL